MEPSPQSQPPMKEKSHADAKSVLLNFGIIIALVSVYSSFLSFVFKCLNTVLPDALENTYYYSISWQDSAIRWSMAVLVVGVPVYSILSWVANKNVYSLALAGSERSSGRKALGAIIVFLSSVTVITNLITLVYFFFGGEITTRFILKSLVTLGSAGGILWYYIYDIRRDPSVRSNVAKIGAVIVIAVTLVAVILGFVVIGSPVTARYQKLDQARVSNLQTIANDVLNYWQSRAVLPQTLSDLEYQYSRIPVDPETKAPYGYKVIDQSRFSLCTTFRTFSVANRPGVYDYSYSGSGVGIKDWSHEAGEKCFEGYIDPAVYQPRNSNPTVPIPKIK